MGVLNGVVSFGRGKARGKVVFGAKKDAVAGEGAVCVFSHDFLPVEGKVINACCGVVFDVSDSGLAGFFERHFVGEEKFPVVGLYDVGCFREGDDVIVDADNKTVEIVGVEVIHVATAVIFSPDGRVMVFRRSQAVGSHRGLWAGVSGHVENGEDPVETAWRELREETGFGPKDLHFLGAGKVLYARGGDRVWAVHPSGFLLKGGGEKPALLKPRLDWENVEYKWMGVDEIKRLEERGLTVPRLWDTVMRVRAF